MLDFNLSELPIVFLKFLDFFHAYCYEAGVQVVGEVLQQFFDVFRDGTFVFDFLFDWGRCKSKDFRSFV